MKAASRFMNPRSSLHRRRRRAVALSCLGAALLGGLDLAVGLLASHSRAAQPPVATAPTTPAPTSTPAPAPPAATSIPPGAPVATGGPGAATAVLEGQPPVLGMPAATPPLLPKTKPPVEERSVVLVLIDGFRQAELLGKAKDDMGRPLRATDVLPNLTALRRSGLFFSRMKISNPAGVSLPGYADLFAGRRQERIVSNYPAAADLRSHYPTMFHELRRQLKLPFDGVMLMSAWAPVCSVAAPPGLRPEEEFYRSCGFNAAGQKDPTAPPPDPASPPLAAVAPRGFKPEVYSASRTDMDTFLELAQELPRRHPRLVVVQFVDADEEAHLHTKIQRRTGVFHGIFHYHQALRASDYYLGRLFALLQSDAFYRDKTYVLVSTDHGRDDMPDAEQWQHHGHCIMDHGARRPCSGCASTFLVAVGPGLAPRVVRTPYHQTDIAPSIVRLLGAELPTATGRPMAELLE